MPEQKIRFLAGTAPGISRTKHISIKLAETGKCMVSGLDDLPKYKKPDEAVVPGKTT